MSLKLTTDRELDEFDERRYLNCTEAEHLTALFLREYSKYKSYFPFAYNDKTRRTVSSHLRKSLPIATVCAMLGHTEETNVKHYSYDVESVENKLKSLKAMYNDFQDKELEVA